MSAATTSTHLSTVIAENGVVIANVRLIDGVKTIVFANGRGLRVPITTTIPFCHDTAKQMAGRDASLASPSRYGTNVRKVA